MITGSILDNLVRQITKYGVVSVHILLMYFHCEHHSGEYNNDDNCMTTMLYVHWLQPVKVRLDFCMAYYERNQT